MRRPVIVAGNHSRVNVLGRYDWPVLSVDRGSRRSSDAARGRGRPSCRLGQPARRGSAV